MECRLYCGACCIAASITSPIPGLPEGKPAGTRCIHLDEDFFCGIYETRPEACKRLFPQLKFCGKTREEALKIIAGMEKGSLKKDHRKKI